MPMVMDSFGGYEQIFIDLLKVQHSHFRHQKTTSNLLRVDLKCKLSFKHWMASRGSHVHKPMVKISGASQKC